MAPKKALAFSYYMRATHFGHRKLNCPKCSTSIGGQSSIFQCQPLRKKVAFNSCRSAFATFRHKCLSSASRLEKYFRDQSDPREGVRMANGFTARYRMLRTEGAEPAEPCQQLLIVAECDQRSGARRGGASYVTIFLLHVRYSSNRRRSGMILPDRNIAPDRALLTIGDMIFERLTEPMTVSGLWDEIRNL